MQNLAPTRKLNRRSRDTLLAAALIFLIGALLMMIGIGLHIVNLVVPSNPGVHAYDLARKAILSLGFGIAFASLLLALRAATWKTDNALARQLGADLARHLDRDFVFIRNISKRQVGYIDAVIVSKYGVLVLRVSGRRGIYINENDDWLRQRRGKWRPMRWNPTREAEAQARRVDAFLQGLGLDAPVSAIIIFTRGAPQLQLTLRQPTVPALLASQLPAYLRSDYCSRARISSAAARHIANALYH